MTISRAVNGDRNQKHPRPRHYMNSLWRMSRQEASHFSGQVTTPGEYQVTF